MSCCSCFGLRLPCPCAQLPPRRRTATARHHPTTLLAPPTRLSNQPASQIHAHSAAVRRPNSLLEYHRPPWREPPAPCRLGILHQDSHLLVVDKPAGLQVGAGQGRAGQGRGCNRVCRLHTCAGLLQDCLSHSYSVRQGWHAGSANFELITVSE